jgi:hypothetical protein
MIDKRALDPIYDVHALAGETLALQAILFGILPRLAAVSPEVRSALAPDSMMPPILSST